jgi:N-methylhydantoinase A
VIERLAAALGLHPLACAEGIIRVANAEMVRALRVVTVERGIDPRSYALIAFGGAGPLHAAAIADELGISTVLCPKASGVLAALGLSASPRRRDVQRTVLLAGDMLTHDAIAQATDKLGAEARRALGEPDASLRAVFELRYRGQSFELAVSSTALAPAPAELRELFEREHHDRYGYRDAEQELELVTVRVSATAPGAGLAAPQADRDEEARPGAPSTGTTSRSATIAGERRELAVHRGMPAAGTAIDGPAVVELDESTLLIPPGWHAVSEPTESIVMHKR